MMIRYLLAAILLAASPAYADVRLPRVIASHMVLQQNAVVKIWGWADPGETVRVAGDWLNADATTTADADGRWQVTIRSGKSDGPHEITVTGNNTITLDDILFGEVWVASGQSNMEMPLVQVSGAYTGIQDSEKEVAAADHPQIRLFQVGNFSSDKPLDDVEAGISMYGVPVSDCQWHVCSPKTVSTFSSAAYFFARELNQTLNVPIGIIDSSWGGTAAEAWTPAAGLKKLGYEAQLQQAATQPQQPDQKVPTRLYNGMIHPLRNLKIKGVIWYQGESNAGQADKYRQLFSTMIQQWRDAFEYEFSFYYVQISPFHYQNLNAAYLREAQLQTMSLPQTGMVVTMDIGNLTDIHPKNKQEVGRRLALWALAKDYDKDLVFSGPTLRKHTIDGSRIILQLDHIGGGLTTRDGNAPSDFEIAGDDHVFHPATAEIDGDRVIVSSDEVSAPKAVRYGFTSESMPNLMNRQGLPASSFRTDTW